MRHAYYGNQLGRPANQAKALYRSLLESMIRLGRIETTKQKAVAVRPDLEKLINLAKKDSLNGRRIAGKILGTEKTLDRLFKDVGPAFGEVTSGFTRIIPLGQRFSDSSQMVIFELTRMPVVVEIIKPEKKVNEDEIKTEVESEKIKAVKKSATKKAVIKKAAKKVSKNDKSN